MGKIEVGEGLRERRIPSSVSCWAVWTNSWAAWMLTGIVLSGNASRASRFLHSSATSALATISCCCLRLVLVAVTSDFYSIMARVDQILGIWSRWIKIVLTDPSWLAASSSSFSLYNGIHGGSGTSWPGNPIGGEGSVYSTDGDIAWWVLRIHQMVTDVEMAHRRIYYYVTYGTIFNKLV